MLPSATLAVLHCLNSFKSLKTGKGSGLKKALVSTAPDSARASVIVLTGTASPSSPLNSKAIGISLLSPKKLKVDWPSCPGKVTRPASFTFTPGGKSSFLPTFLSTLIDISPICESTLGSSTPDFIALIKFSWSFKPSLTSRFIAWLYK